MDMQYLLWLQDLRANALVGLEDLLAFFSDTATFFVILMCVLYVTVDKKKFCHVLFCYSICSSFNALIKITACVYRPWIKDPRIVPARKSLGLATGYSFPSGHTSAVASCALGTISQYRDKLVLVIILSIYALLVAFSRNFLGCHTPQDVLFALAEAALSLWAASLLMKAIEKKEGSDKILFVSATILFAAFFTYALFKPYPVDLDAAGEVLVSPKKMQNDAMFDFAFAIGFVHGWFLDRRFIKFTTDNISAKQRILRFALMLIFALVINFVIYAAAKHYFDKRFAKFIKGYLFSFATAYLTPLAFTKIERALKW
ncbi:MAG: phosphatase PAP2 family protein [Treponema sp.]|nr:phosphatase PAP2 family protein [Treponema sp.]